MSILALTLSCAGIFALAALSLLILGKGKFVFPGHKEWTISFILFVASLLSITLRKYDYLLVSILLGNAFQFSAYYMLALGALRFLGKDYKDHWMAFVFLIFILGIMGILSLESNFHNARFAIVSILAATFSFSIASFFKSFGKGLYRFETLAKHLFYIHALFSVLKIVLSLIDHEREGLFSSTLISQITFYEYLLMTILWTIVINLLSINRISLDKAPVKLPKTAS